MADAEVWGPDFALVAAPAATDRFPVATSPGTGGYAERREFMFRDATGRFIAQGGGANGAGLIDVTYGAPGNSTTALRATLNSGNGGAYLSGYSAEANFGHNSHFISGSGWMAAHTDAARYTQSGGAHIWYSNSGLTPGSAFTPTELMRINASGNVGIGTAAPIGRLHVNTNSTAESLVWAGNTSNGACVGMIGGNKPGVGSHSQTTFYIMGSVASTPVDLGIFTSTGLGIGSSPTAKLTISNAGAAGLEVNPSGGLGGGPTIVGYNRATSSYVSVTSYAASQSFFCGTGAAIRALDIDANGDVYSGVDNLKKLGLASNRWSVAYFGSNPIVTCDVRFKTYRAEPGPTEAELRAARRCVDELGFFQSNDTIAEKGVEDARWHFGPRAQAIWMHWADEDLCPALVEVEVVRDGVAIIDLLPPEGSVPPAFLCFDEWGEETEEVMEEVEVEKTRIVQRESSILDPTTGAPLMVDVPEAYTEIEMRPTGETRVTREAGNRFGVRIDQLHSLMIAALNAERLAQAATAEAQTATIESLEARLLALEAAA